MGADYAAFPHASLVIIARVYEKTILDLGSERDRYRAALERIEAATGHGSFTRQQIRACARKALQGESEG